MKTIFAMFIALWVQPLASLPTTAQDFSSLQNRLTDLVRQQEPAWKLTHQEKREGFAYYQWEWAAESGKQGAVVQLFYESSKEKAEKGLQGLIHRISVGYDRKLQGIGDEAYIWEEPTRGSGVIRFRKANVYADIGAPSVALAERLAQEVVKLIADR